MTLRRMPARTAIKHNAAALAAAFVFLAGCGDATAPGRGEASRVEWTTMGTIAAVQCRGRDPAPVRDAAKVVFAEIESLLNAHDPGSELSRLAVLSDAAVLERCSPRVRPCYEAAFAMAEETGGAFNPRWRGRNTLDLGAIAKGYAVDLAADAVRGVAAPEGGGEDGDGGVLIDLGGNLKAVRGDWRIGIHGGEGIFTLREGEAAATSGEYFRGSHIRDGRTGAAPASHCHSVTVIHPTSATAADALSTVLFILGRDAGDAFLRARHPEARAIWTE